MLDRRTALGLIAAATAAPAHPAEPLKGQPALPAPLDRYRELPVKRLDGAPTTLGRLLGAPRPTVLSFWATWCAPCALEGRRLARLRSVHPDERLAIIGLNIDVRAEPARLELFRRKSQMNYTQGLEGRTAYEAIAGTAAVALPRTYVFDAAGHPTAAFGRFFGERTLAAIDAAVAAVLRG